MNRTLILCLAAIALPIHLGHSAPEILQAAGVHGGFIVHVGCRDANQLSQLRAGDAFVVQGLDTSTAAVAAARQALRDRNLYGPVSAIAFDGVSLPYVADIVNLIVIHNADHGANLSAAEVRRVLAPRGILATTHAARIPGLEARKTGDWFMYREPVPAAIDEWTHFLHDSRGTSVSGDTFAGPPRGLRWTGAPIWARSHEHTAGMNAMVSAEGRVFYVMDEGPVESIQLPASHVLVARDAFSGTVLWKRPLPHWWNHLYPLKSGPSWLPRRLVAVGDRVYVSPGAGQDLLCLDAATGRTILTCADTATPFEVIVNDGIVLVAIDVGRTPCDYRQEHANCWKERDRASTTWQWTPETGQRLLKAIEAATGATLWSREHPITPLSLTADQRIVCFHDGNAVVALDRRTGTERWQTRVTRLTNVRTGYGGPRLILHGDTVVFAPMGSLYALSADTGELLWSVAKRGRSGHFSLEDVYVLGDTVWALQRANRGAFTTYSLADGTKLADYTNPIDSFYIHQRCYPGRATLKYQLPPMMGIQVYDMANDSWTNNHWVRGGCIYGIMPANGMVYTPPHACACYYQSKLNGFNAIAPEPERAEPPPAATRLTRGQAYERPRSPSATNPADWPVFRHDNNRSGYARTDVPAALQPAWRVRLGTRLSQVVAAGDTLFVSAIDQHTVHALDAANGSTKWAFVAGGRIDSPPTLYRGLALFGCADGCVYAVDAGDGALAWRFQAAPSARRLMACGQPESVWPISGSVLIQNDRLYCVAGRSMFLDGGLRMIILDPLTGHLISENVMDDHVPGTEDQTLADLMMGKHMPVAMPDILSSDGTYVYMKSQTFDLGGRRIRIKPQRPDTQYGNEVHLFAPVGFLDGAWHQRTYWIYGRAAGEGWAEFQYPPKRVPCGRILCIDDTNAYSYGRDPELLCNTSVTEYRLFSAARIPTRKVGIPRLEGTWEPGGLETPKQLQLAANSVDWHQMAKQPAERLSALDYNWLHEEPPVMARAMVLANDRLFLAGPRDVADEKALWGRSNDEIFQTSMADQAAWNRGQYGSILQVFAKQDGSKIAEMALDSMPVFDGLIAAHSKLYMTTTDGSVICLAGP